MNRILLLFLFIYPCTFYSQESKAFDVQNYYLTELINSFEEKSFAAFDIDDVNWRKRTVKKLVSVSNVQEASFLKTAMVLHMLKYKLSDVVFNKAVENYKLTLEKDSKKADLLDFQYHLENESNLELTSFFNDWFKSKGHPSYKISWFQKEDSNEISFSIKQLQSNTTVDFFDMPLPIKLVGEDDESQLVRLELSQNGQSFNGTIPFKVVTIKIDPEYHLISNNNIVKKGIDQEVLNKEISLYPNPAVNLIKIQNTSKATVEKVSIYNMLGKLVLEEFNPLIAISLKPLSAGVHLVKIETSQGTLHKTILKK